MKTKLITAVALSGALALSSCSGTATTSPQTASTTGTGSTTSSPAAAATAPDRAESAKGIAEKMAKAMVDAKSGKTTATVSGAASMEMTSEFVFSTPTQIDMHATMAVSGMNLEVISKGGIFYMKGLPPAASGGKPWIKADPNGTDAFSKQMSSQLSQMGDPAQITKAFEGGTVKLVGEEGGLRHYSVSGVGATGNLEIYLDKDDRPAKIDATASGATVKATYSDWGTPVTITEPPADQVGTLKTAG